MLCAEQRGATSLCDITADSVVLQFVRRDAGLVRLPRPHVHLVRHPRTQRLRFPREYRAGHGSRGENTSGHVTVHVRTMGVCVCVWGEGVNPRSGSCWAAEKTSEKLPV